MDDPDPRWKRLARSAEFWILLVLIAGSTLYGTGRMILSLIR
ncbi:cytochrome c oxidase subunit 7 [Sphingopyxis sp. H115]|nr:cytochrome c oxidase subunit 7 [Sphingopyxis sp. H115]